MGLLIFWKGVGGTPPGPEIPTGVSTVIWGAYNLPTPDLEGIKIEQIPIEASKRMLSGRLRIDVLARYNRISIPWPYLTSTEWSLLYGYYVINRDVETSLTIPDGQTFDNVVCTSSWPENHFYEVAEIPYYSVTLEFEETLT